MVLHQQVVVMTLQLGGNGMDVENLPDNLEGKESTDNSDLKPKSSVQLSDRQKQLLQKKIEKQKKFLDGDIKKKKLTKKDISNVPVRSRFCARN